MSIKSNLEKIQSGIEKACKNANRKTSEVHLLAVSKLQSLEKIEEAYALGIRDFGENYVQELIEKKEKLSHLPEIRWHFIGHLQTNKAKQVTQNCSFFHSLDSEKLLNELTKHSKGLNCFIQVNVDEEESKSGVPQENVLTLVKASLLQEKIKLAGLMIIPKPREAQSMRPVFQSFCTFARQIEKQAGLPPQKLQLSMGMSEDFEVAVEEGSHWIRVGQKLFGERKSG